MPSLSTYRTVSFCTGLLFLPTKNDIMNFVTTLVNDWKKQCYNLGGGGGRGECQAAGRKEHLMFVEDPCSQRDTSLLGHCWFFVCVCVVSVLFCLVGFFEGVC